MSVAVSTTDPEHFLIASAAMACAALGLRFDPETRGALTHDQRFQILARAGHKALQTAQRELAGRRNAPEFIP